MNKQLLSFLIPFYITSVYHLQLALGYLSLAKIAKMKQLYTFLCILFFATSGQAQMVFYQLDDGRPVMKIKFACP